MRTGRSEIGQRGNGVEAEKKVYRGGGGEAALGGCRRLGTKSTYSQPFMQLERLLKPSTLYSLARKKEGSRRRVCAVMVCNAYMYVQVGEAQQEPTLAVDSTPKKIKNYGMK